MSIVVEQVTKNFVRNREEIIALDNFSLSIAKGEFVAFVGPSGCGKSTLLNMIAGILPVEIGRINHDGRPVKGINTAVGYMTQVDSLLPWRTAETNVTLPLSLKGYSAEKARERCAELLQMTNLEGFEGHFPAELSGGMRKRVALAQVLSYRPDTLLMDEPFGALDAQLKLVMQDELMKIWERERQTVVFVTHDLAEAITLADRVIVFSGRPGRLKLEEHITIPRPRDVFKVRFTKRVPGHLRTPLGKSRIRDQEGGGPVMRYQTAEAAEIPVSKAVQAVEARKVFEKRIRLVGQIMVGVFIIGFWEFSSRYLVDPFFISSPMAVLAKLSQWISSGELIHHLSITLYATVMGFFIGSIGGFTFGFIFGRYERIGAIFDPYITAIYCLPKIALAPPVHHVVRDRDRIESGDERRDRVLSRLPQHLFRCARRQPDLYSCDPHHGRERVAVTAHRNRTLCSSVGPDRTQGIGALFADSVRSSASSCRPTGGSASSSHNHPPCSIGGRPACLPGSSCWRWSAASSTRG